MRALVWDCLVLVLVCCALPVISQTCGNVMAGGKAFDLSPLHAHYVWNQVLSGNTYYLSACEDLVRPATTCADTSCVGYEVDGVGSCWCLGKASTATWSTYQGNPQVLYTGGSKRTTVTNSMVVTLMCSQTEQKPTAATENNFQYSFIWKTPAACPAPAPASCGKVAVGGSTFDFSSLHNDSVSGLQIAGNRYYFSGCEDILMPATTCADTTCIGYQIDGVGNCWCLGKASTATWSLVQDKIVVAYSGGSQRSATARNSMSIMFVCSTSEYKPTSVTEQNFNYAFTWESPAACVHPLPTCGFVTIDGVKFDFSLFHGDKAWDVQIADSTYYVSACEAIAPEPSDRCIAIDSGCVGYQIDGTGNCWCLGNVSTAQWSFVAGSPMVSYSGGSQRTASVSNSMNITFPCSQTEIAPTSVSQDSHFNYAFVWATPVACVTAGLAIGSSDPAHSQTPSDDVIASLTRLLVPRIAHRTQSQSRDDATQ